MSKESKYNKIEKIKKVKYLHIASSKVKSKDLEDVMNQQPTIESSAYKLDRYSKLKNQQDERFLSSDQSRFKDANLHQLSDATRNTNCYGYEDQKVKNDDGKNNNAQFGTKQWIKRINQEQSNQMPDSVLIQATTSQAKGKKINKTEKLSKNYRTLNVNSKPKSIKNATNFTESLIAANTLSKKRQRMRKEIKSPARPISTQMMLKSVSIDSQNSKDSESLLHIELKPFLGIRKSKIKRRRMRNKTNFSNNNITLAKSIKSNSKMRNMMGKINNRICSYIKDQTLSQNGDQSQIIPTDLNNDENREIISKTEFKLNSSIAVNQTFDKIKHTKLDFMNNIIKRMNIDSDNDFDEY